MSKPIHTIIPYAESLPYFYQCVLSISAGFGEMGPSIIKCFRYTQSR
ncbi:hypothetical protein KL86CLO1_11320 [uncultured Eubacteriales bacterium]|uniref:Uncharacterized protein n=1 Tax=uncultured Eubacteriales bacterium TaxID=172733 RepID=A0A212JLH0_9FIRM|nr:hypothetical protein KL86CLO1_11320 [uncultured Eubacteriales bacterium]